MCFGRFLWVVSAISLRHKVVYLNLLQLLPGISEKI